MRDLDFDVLFASLDGSVSVDPVFANRLFAALVNERARARRRPVWIAALAAASVAILGGALLFGAGGRGLGPVALGRSPTPLVSPATTRATEPTTRPVTSSPVPTTRCAVPTAPIGATNAGCIDVHQTFTWSLDTNEMQNRADLWFEAVTPTEFFLTRSFDWAGPMTELRMAVAGGRDGCVAALRTRDPGATAWPVQTDEAHMPDYPHGIPFTDLSPTTPICAVSLGGDLFELRLERLIQTGRDAGNPVYDARFTWIDWGPAAP